MRLPPPEVVASWPEPNHTNPVTRGPTLLIVELITLSIALICLGLRLYVRLGILKTSGLDDWLMVGAAIFGTGVTVCVVLAVDRYGWNIHIWDLTIPVMVAGRQVSFAAQALFVPASSLAKLSILVSYLRLAPNPSWFRRLTFAAMWYVAIVNVTLLAILFSQCIPLSSYWRHLGDNRDCITEGPAVLSQAITAAVADFIVWVLPLPALYRAKLPLGQRLALILLFSFAAVVVIAACLRTYWIYYVVEETYDVTWYGFHLWLWTAIEVHLGIICGCVPWLKSLVTFVRQKWKPVTDLIDKRRSEFGGQRELTAAEARKQGFLTRVGSFGRERDGETDAGADGNSDMQADRRGDRASEEWVDLESCISANPAKPSVAHVHVPNNTPGLAL